NTFVRGHPAAETVRLAGADGRGQGGLAVVDVADGADVDVRLGPREHVLRHVTSFKSPGTAFQRRAGRRGRSATGRAGEGEERQGEGKKSASSFGVPPRVRTR